MLSPKTNKLNEQKQLKIDPHRFTYFAIKKRIIDTSVFESVLVILSTLKNGVLYQERVMIQEGQSLNPVKGYKPSP